MIGWIKLHRSLLEWEWYDDKNALTLLIHLLVTVNYEDKKWKGISVQSGSRITSWDSLKMELKSMSKQQIRTAMYKLENSGEITRQTTNKYQVITLVKWYKLQCIENTSNTQNNTVVKTQITHNQHTNNTQITHNQHTNNTQITPTKEYNNLKEFKEIKKPIKNTLLSEIKISDLEDEKIKKYFEIAEAFRNLFIKNQKERGAPISNQEKAKFKNYVDPIRLMIEVDEVTIEQLTKVFKFLDSTEGEFWKPNILSTSKLREKFTNLIMKSNESRTTNKTVNRQTADVIRKNSQGWEIE